MSRTTEEGKELQHGEVYRCMRRDRKDGIKSQSEISFDNCMGECVSHLGSAEKWAWGHGWGEAAE